MKNIFYRSLKTPRSVINGLFGFCYDFLRFLSHTSATSVVNHPQQSYRITKIYHTLEKSLSFRTRQRDSGWQNAERLIQEINSACNASRFYGFQENVAVKVLTEFVNSAPSDSHRTSSSKTIKQFIETLPPIAPHTPGGAVKIHSSSILAGRLDNPERFFFSRRSVRDFSRKPVPKEMLLRAVQLASSSPSVCNRQAWHVYHIDERSKIDRALSFQNGNRGFGHEVNTLLILTADLAAFDSGSERYQHWIDGGMFSMSLVMALHSLGIATCCLNWSKGPRHDMAFRKVFQIQGSHSVLMLLAVGHPNDELKVCASPRRPLEEMYTAI